MATRRDHVDRHEAGRLIAFSDGVVAIAITLLILPLASLDLPSQGQASTDPLGYIWQQNSTVIISFLITWAVIVTFWFVHHRIFGSLREVNDRILSWNIVWLFGIVVLPFPMNLLEQVNATASSNSALRQTTVFYIATMLVISLAMSMISEQILRNPDLLTEKARERPTTPRLVIWSFTGYLAILAVIALIAPGFGLWGLIGLAFIKPVVAWILSAREPRAPKRWVAPAEKQAPDTPND